MSKQIQIEQAQQIKFGELQTFNSQIIEIKVN